MRTIFVTGTAGFIGFHLARLLIAEGFRVVGIDAMTDYYDITLKRRRHARNVGPTDVPGRAVYVVLPRDPRSRNGL